MAAPSAPSFDRSHSNCREPRSVERGSVHLSGSLRDSNGKVLREDRIETVPGWSAFKDFDHRDGALLAGRDVAPTDEREGDLMIVHPILTEEGLRTSAFEIDSACMGPAGIARLLAGVEGVTGIRRRRPFSPTGVHVEFLYLGCPFVVWEPWGDNSRYWIGPQLETAEVPDTTPLEMAFRRYQPPALRRLAGTLLSLGFLPRRGARRQ